MKYFAYGSNMYSRRLAERISSCRFHAVAWLPEYRLAFHKRGSDGSGKCDVVYTGNPGDTVPGVVYEIGEADRRILDAIEGVGRGYLGTSRDVVVAGKRATVYLYVTDERAVDETVRPFCWYRDFVLAGAREHGFPEAYLRMLEGVGCDPDPRPERERLNRRLLQGDG